MPSYNLSTRGRIADIKGGLRVDTGSLAATTYLDHDPSLNHELFTVAGTILLLNLFFEVTTDLSAHAAQIVWNATFSAPAAYTVQPLGTKCASVSALKAGHRIVWGGGILATAATITTQPCISDFAAVAPILVGAKAGIGTIGSLCTDASCASGAMFCSLFYIPYSNGAYVEALV
jgi:hypothetical protein